MKNIIFVSDLHLGVGRRNDFHASYHFHKLLDYAAENCSEFVILGDLLELLQCEFLEIYAEHHLIFEHLFELAEKIPVKYVIGNHDVAAGVDFNPRGESHFLGSKIEVLTEYENLPFKIFAAHGHQFSLANHRDNDLDPSEISAGDRVAQIVGWLEKNVHPKIDNLAEKIYIGYKKMRRKISGDAKNFAELVTPAHPDYLKLGGDFSEYDRGARDILASERYSLCIFGHTHIPEIKNFDGKIYANCGSWVGDDPVDSPPIFLDVDEKFVRMIDAKTFEMLKNVERKKIPKNKIQSGREKVFRNKVLI